MNKDHIVVNTLVFQKALENGGLQHRLFSGLKQLGVRNVEVRREYIRNEREFRSIAEAAWAHDLAVFYSVPDCLFAGGDLQSDQFVQYINEAKMMNARMMKLTRGEFRQWSDPDLSMFREVTESYQGLVTVENDQTPENGKVKALLQFFEASESAEVPIYATFDIGNCLWVGEDPLQAAAELRPFTKYVHLKDVLGKNGQPMAAYLGDGEIPWRKVLESFKPDVYAAIEYPCGDDPYERLKKEIEKLTTL